MIALAEILDRFSFGQIGTVVAGLIATLGIIVLVLTGLNQARQFFGKRPTLNEVMRQLVTVDEHDKYKGEVNLRCVKIEKEIEDSRQDAERRANVNLLDAKKINETIFRLIGEADSRGDRLNGVVSKLEERTETHSRKFDYLDGKIDRALERIPAAQRHSRPGGST